jgi:hypothetical protein
MDAVTSRLFALIPALQELPEHAWFIFGSIEAGLVIILIVAALWAFLARRNLGSSPDWRGRSKTRQDAALGALGGI